MRMFTYTMFTYKLLYTNYYIQTIIYTRLHAHVYMHTFTCTRLHAHVYMHTFTCTRLHAHVYIRTCFLILTTFGNFRYEQNSKSMFQSKFRTHIFHRALSEHKNKYKTSRLEIFTFWSHL